MGFIDIKLNNTSQQAYHPNTSEQPRPRPAEKEKDR